jgi:hypothetical protein
MDITTELHESQENVARLLKKEQINLVIRSFSIRGFIYCHMEKKYPLHCQKLKTITCVETSQGLLEYVVQMTSLDSENSGFSLASRRLFTFYLSYIRGDLPEKAVSVCYEIHLRQRENN